MEKDEHEPRHPQNQNIENLSLPDLMAVRGLRNCTAPVGRNEAVLPDAALLAALESPPADVEKMLMQQGYILDMMFKRLVESGFNRGFLHEDELRVGLKAQKQYRDTYSFLKKLHEEKIRANELNKKHSDAPLDD